MGLIFTALCFAGFGSLSAAIRLLFALGVGRVAPRIGEVDVSHATPGADDRAAVGSRPGARFCRSFSRTTLDYQQIGRKIIMASYLLVHGAWHTGWELEPVAAAIKAAGHEPFTPTMQGNRPGDPKTIGLTEAIQSTSFSSATATAA
jgi:hypothetical protein